MEKVPQYALSVRQPWATLILHGLKSIEIRAWPTRRRGKVYIHAARIGDDRPHGWKLLPEAALEMTQLRGGLIGTVEVTDCLTYANRDEFRRDQELHRNDPTWFTGDALYGFRLAKPQIVPFVKLSGWVRFFTVKLPSEMTQKIQ